MGRKTPAAIAEAQPPVTDQVLALPVDQVDMGERLRPIDPAYAEALAAVIRQDGQEDPIKVCRLPGKSGWLLVTGGHRLAACRLIGGTVNAIVVNPDRAERLRREISENLFRSGLGPIDRAAFVAEMIDLQRARAGVEPETSPQSVAANARWKNGLKKQSTDASVTMTHAYGFADGAAEALGLSRETIYRDLTLHRGLPPGLVAQLRGLPVASNAGQLRALAKMEPGDQVAVVRMLRDGEAKGVSEAFGILRQKPPADMAKKARSAFFGGWSRMTARQRRDALRELADLGLPRGARIVFEGDADA
jgi:hypothetical protein